MSNGEEYTLLQYMNFSDPLGYIDKRPGCVHLRRSTDDQMDHTQGREGGKETSVSYS